MNLDLVLRDLAVPGGVTPAAITGKPGHIFLYGVDGSAHGIDPDLPLAELADRVQEWAVEDLWTRGMPTNWPPCPGHPSSHPLEAAESDGRGVWRCPRTAQEIAEIGSLPIPG